MHISRVYRGLSDNLYKFAISAPILDNEEKFLGVIATSVTTDATIGLVYLHDDSREVALIAPRDVDSREPRQQGTLGKYVVLFHPAYRRGVHAVEFPNTTKIGRIPEPLHDRQLQLPDSNLLIPPEDDYRDPVSSVTKDYEGRWIAGFAPVGNTGFVVVVQQRFEEAVSLESSTFWNLALWSALVSCVAVAILVMVLWRWARSRRLAVG